MYLCHKCEGVLKGPKPEGMYWCGCISGYIREGYPQYTEEEARARQAAFRAKYPSDTRAKV